MKLRHKVELPNQEYLVRRRRLRRKVSEDETVQRQQVWEGTGPGWRFADFAAGFEAQNLNPKHPQPYTATHQGPRALSLEGSCDSGYI